MILRPEQIRLLHASGRANPYNFGGDSSSDSSTATTSNVRNDATSIDKRSVASDAAVSLTGDNNTVDRSTTSTSTTNFLDVSNRSTNFADSSNRSTTFTDNSNKSVNTTTTDYGSVQAALSGITQMGSKALDVTDNGINGVVGALKMIADGNAKTAAAAFDLSKAQSAGALTNSAQVLGFANSALEKTADAFAQASDGGQSKMVMYAIGAVALVATAFALKS